MRGLCFTWDWVDGREIFCCSQSWRFLGFIVSTASLWDSQVMEGRCQRGRCLLPSRRVAPVGTLVQLDITGKDRLSK